MSDKSNKRPVHGVVEYPSNPTVVFDTICTKHRAPWIANEDVHQLLREVWESATHWRVGKYVLMPDHIHMFAWATEASGEFDNWVRFWKSQFTKLNRDGSHRWQPDHWDVRIRTSSSYEEKWNYMRDNPVRHGLVSQTDDWPFQGELFKLEWSD